MELKSLFEVCRKMFDKVTLKKSFVDQLTDEQYQSVFLLVRMYSTLRMKFEILQESILNGKFRNHEILDIYSDLFAVYSEAAKAYSKRVHSYIYKIIGREIDEFTKDLISIASLGKEQLPPHHKVILFLRDNTTFHFFSEYISPENNRYTERIRLIGYFDHESNGKLRFTGSTPHILGVISEIAGIFPGEEDITSLFRTINSKIIHPFIEHLGMLVFSVVDGNRE